jgi:hypothetical protein
MFSKLLIAWGLMALCVVVHATGVSSAVRWLRYRTTAAGRFWFGTWLFVRLAGWIVLLHLIEITTWALLYVRNAAMADLPTTGYGDLVLPPEWRLVGAVEALTGILMCGWSTGFFFVVVSRMFQADEKTGAQ